MKEKIKKIVKNILKVIAIVIIIYLLIFNVRVFSILNKEFDMTATSFVNLMPTFPQPKEPTKAIFRFRITGKRKDTFFEKYDIESIKLNDVMIDNTEISKGTSGFSFYSSEYKTKEKNKIELTIINKKTKKKIVRKYEVETQVAV